MKVLSIKEPFATLIANGKKKIETRSWKTNYRGEMFIHASGKTLAKEILSNDYIKNIIKNMSMNYGNIICRCNLVDCIYVDEKCLKEIKQNSNEYLLGDYKIGRYAWIIKDVTLIHPIPAKGQLNIWNYYGKYKLKE